MKRTATKVGKRRIELSNLDKVLFPESGIIKAELIEYYLKAAPTLLRHTKGRPLSLVRFPDGIEGESFFQKQKPRYAPDWLAHVRTGGASGTDYIVATEEASLVWLANQACIELHQTQCRMPHLDRPDYMVFDLDPPDGFPFGDLLGIALALREHVQSYGYHAFAKTSGGKGLHILAPVEPEHGYDRVFEAVSDVARPFVKAHGSATTLQLKKAARGGKVLVDIYRNRPSQTIVSPYSVRGKPGAPVSTPLTWDKLEALEDPRDWNLRTTLDSLMREGDPWESIGAYAVKLHTARKVVAAADPARPRSKPASPSALRDYTRKRRFDRTPEPPADAAREEGRAFVVHRHHASRLHYDLRLQQEGSLKSWAVPKGLPPRPGVKRLAVAVEDHPVSYLTFEGTIPKGEYGAGQVWVFALGRHEITREKRDGFYFRLHSREISAEYRLIRTRGKECLLERVDPLQIDWLRDPVEPMLCHSRQQPPETGEYLFEVKWDGIRAMIALEDGAMTIRSRNLRDLTAQFPELHIAQDAFRAGCALFDAEIVCLDAEGKPVFEHALRRLQHRSEAAIARGRARHPAVCYLFDCLYLDGRPIVDEPLERRREWMQDAVKPNPVIRVSEAVRDGHELFEASARLGLEGIIAKACGSPYLPGARSEHWLKIKTRQTAECLVLGYTRGKGGRESSFGALHLGRLEDDRIRYLGRVGTGFTDRLLKSIHKELKKLPERRKAAAADAPPDPGSVWLRPDLVCEVQFASWTREGHLREPVFLRLRPDLSGEAPQE